MGDYDGNVRIFGQKDNLFSEWIQYYHVHIGHTEQVIAAEFFHGGRNIVMQQDKKDITNYMEKYQQTPFSPSCRSTGGVAATGVIVVTQTRSISAFLIPSDVPSMKALNGTQNPVTLPIELSSTTIVLEGGRIYCSIADIYHTKSE